MFADMTTGETSVAVIITGLVLNWLSNTILGLWTAWLSYKGKQAADKSTVASEQAVQASTHNTSLIADNTVITKETNIRVNGVMDKARTDAHEAGYVKGKAEAAVMALALVDSNEKKAEIALALASKKAS